MEREEFLRGLTEALSGEVPAQVIQDNLRYYRDYIDSEVGKGRSESQVMEELGSPRLIARTIIDATPGSGEGAFEEYKPGGTWGRGDGMGTGAERNAKASGEANGRYHYYDLNKWYWKLLGVLLVIGIVTLVLLIVGGILSLVIPMLPVIGIVILIMWFVRGGSSPWR